MTRSPRTSLISWVVRGGTIVQLTPLGCARGYTIGRKIPLPGNRALFSGGFRVSERTQRRDKGAGIPFVPRDRVVAKVLPREGVHRPARHAVKLAQTA